MEGPVLNYTHVTGVKGETEEDFRTGNVNLTSRQIGALDINGPGRSIPSDANLNNYTEQGAFYCLNSARAKQISNSPITDAGYKIYVIQDYPGANSTGDRKIQLMIGPSSFKIRGTTNNGSTWTEWKKLGE